MWEYKIYKTNLWWSIYRKKYIGKVIILQYLNGYGLRSHNKDYAKIFYTEDDAESALVIQRSKEWKTDTTSTKKSESEGEREKK